MANSYYEVMQTWKMRAGFNAIFSASPLWLINKAIKKILFKILEDHLLEGKRNIDKRIPTDREMLLACYPDVANKLKFLFLLTNQDEDKQDISKIQELTGKQNASKIYLEVGLDKENKNHLNMLRKAEEVEE